MLTKIIEAVQGIDTPANWGKFMLGRPSVDELAYRSEVDGLKLIHARGWSDRHIWVLDLQTGEGGIFMPGGYAKADLTKRAIWVCPLFEPFLEWLYKQEDPTDFDKLPSLVELPNAPFEMQGYRRAGPGETQDARTYHRENAAELAADILRRKLSE